MQGNPGTSREQRVFRIDQALPQTQCTRCGYADCHAYAVAIVDEGAAINRCPPGGQAGVQRLAALTGQADRPLDRSCGSEGPRRIAWIDEAWCIGCTLCIKACPVDCIVGAPKALHTVIEADCTGCDLCAPACPVDCIRMELRSDTRTGWAAWGEEQALAARQAYEARNRRRERLDVERTAEREAAARHALEHLTETTVPAGEAEQQRRRAVIAAALARSRRDRENPTG